MFKFCPSCASEKITFEEGKVFRCPDCDFIFYHNVAAATGCLIVVPEDGAEYAQAGERKERLVFLVRGKEPAIGKLDLPGGFVDAGEGIMEGLCRELREEIGWTPTIPEGKTKSDVLKFFASFPNIYEYKGTCYNTCDMYFYACAQGLKPEDLKLEKAEVAAVRFLKPEEIEFSDFAFDSTVQAVRAYLNR